MANNSPFYSEGRYHCEITDQGLTKAQTGTVQIVIKFRVLSCIQPQGEVPQQYERTSYLPVTEKTMEYLIPKLETLGYTRDSLKYFNLEESNCHDLRGHEVVMFCKHESAQDGSGMREKWDVARGDSSAPLELKPPDPKDIRNLDMLFGRARKSAGVSTKTQTATAVRVPADDGITDDDCPF